MGPADRTHIARYGFALLAVAVAFLVRLLLDPVLGNRLPFLFSCLAVVLVAWYSGYGPSLLTVVLGLLTTAYYFLPPRYSFAESLDTHQVTAIGFVILGVMIGWFSEGLRRARARAEAHAREAVRQRHELEQEIARRKCLEQELQLRAEELAGADRRKDEFLAMLGHELRNPLAPISSAVQIMRGHELPDPRLRWARDVIDRQASLMARLVDDLLDLSRISRGKIWLHKEPVELGQVIAQAVETSRPSIETRRQELTVALPPTPLLVEGDAMRLAQVFLNLLNNAAKFTELGGHIWLTVEANAGQAVVRVRDDGRGIAADLLPKVFDLFMQGDQSLARSEGGLGIGLTLVKCVVELHAGSVEASSAGPGKGSEFVVRVPALKTAGDLPSASKPQDGRHAKSSACCRILVVDDNVDAAETLAMWLTVNGHEVRTAHDGPAALETAATFQPEVAFLDIGLPGMTGYEIAQRVRGRAGLPGWPLLVALTGYGQEEDRRRAKEAGFDHHLVKPVDPGDLLAVLDGVRV